VLGAVAPRLLGGRTAPSLLEGALLGVAGAVLGGLVGWYAIHSRIAGFVLAALLTLALVYSIRTVSSSV
jgi:hypothetical protein